ncbi:UDP-N-acetylmuramate--L-alanine ligase [soil metagenome]
MTRPAGEIGAGLLPARAARPIAAGERIHVLGAAGAGASAAALLAHHAGAQVSGCDSGGPSPYSRAIESLGVMLDWRHSPEHLAPDATGRRPGRLAVTKALTSVAPDHPELVAARAAGVLLEPWQQVVADAAATQGARLVAVAGTHGKSTTSGWLLDLLLHDGRDPSAFVGALLPRALTGAEPATARWGGGGLFVVEADEYAGNFDAYRPDVALLLNAEWDHPDVFADGRAVEAAFESWLRVAAADGRQPTVVANMDDDGVARICRRLDDWPGTVVGVAFDEQRAAVVRGRLSSPPGEQQLIELERPDGATLRLPVGLAGRHNAANALVLCAAAYVLGAEDSALASSLAEFGGVGRRMELKGDVGGVIVLDDYGHHPTAIERTLEAARQRYPGRRLWAVYEPLTFHRTAQMFERFADVLAAGADQVAIADIWPGRDQDTTVTSSIALAAAINARGGAPAVAAGSVEATADHLATEVEPGDVVLVMGGGRSYVIADRLVELLDGGPR